MIRGWVVVRCQFAESQTGVLLSPSGPTTVCVILTATLLSPLLGEDTKLAENSLIGVLNAQSLINETKFVAI